MKKSRKPLTLSTETVRSLSNTRLAQAAGGFGKSDLAGSCSDTLMDCYTSYCDSNICRTSYCAGTEFSC